MIAAFVGVVKEDRKYIQTRCIANWIQDPENASTLIKTNIKHITSHIKQTNTNMKQTKTHITHTKTHKTYQDAYKTNQNAYKLIETGKRT